MNEDWMKVIKACGMNKLEAKAWKVAVMYMELTKKYFPDYNHYTIGKDPRRSSLFKYCYKLVRECDQYLEDHEYRLYLTAQLQIMKNINYGPGCQAFIQPNCIAGDKAWKRWLVWKKKFYDKVQIEAEKPEEKLDKVVTFLAETKVFLQRKFSELSRQNVLDSLESRAMFRWCALGEVSGYYMAMSPLVDSWVKSRKVDLLDAFALDLSHYRRVNRETEEFFRREFAYEF